MYDANAPDPEEQQVPFCVSTDHEIARACNAPSPEEENEVFVLGYN